MKRLCGPIPSTVGRVLFAGRPLAGQVPLEPARVLVQVDGVAAVVGDSRRGKEAAGGRFYFVLFSGNTHGHSPNISVNAFEKWLRLE